MHTLVKEGKVRAVGQSAYSDEDFERDPRAQARRLAEQGQHGVDHLFIRPGGKLQALMKQYGCTFVAFGPLDQGILLDKFDPETPKFAEGDYRNQRKDMLPDSVLRVLKPKMQQTEGPLRPDDRGAVIRRLPLRVGHDHVCSTIPGFRMPRQAACNLKAASDPAMSDADLEFCRRLFA